MYGRKPSLVMMRGWVASGHEWSGECIEYARVSCVDTMSSGCGVLVMTSELKMLGAG